MPKAVFSGTAIAVISSVSFSACTAFGFEIAAQNGCTAVLERAPEDEPDRRDEDQREIAERERSGRRT